MSINKITKTVAAAAVMAALTGYVVPEAQAGDSPFGYIYTTDLHPKGEWELEQWVTNRRGKSRGDYEAYLYRTEIEYGITDNLQVSQYLNYNSVDAFRDNVDGTTGGKFVPDGVNPMARYRKSFYDSTSTELIYRVLSPYKDPIGLALYIEPTYGPKHKELEGKIILQKNFLDDQLVWAGNATVAYEREKYSGAWEKETELEFTTGLAYRFAANWHGGWEFRNHRDYEGYGLKNSKRAHSAYFTGPSLHYSDRKWWATVTYMPQLPWARAYNDKQRQDIVGGRIYGEEHERRELRVRFGITF